MESTWMTRKQEDGETTVQVCEGTDVVLDKAWYGSLKENRRVSNFVTNGCVYVKEWGIGMFEDVCKEMKQTNKVDKWKEMSIWWLKKRDKMQ